MGKVLAGMEPQQGEAGDGGSRHQLAALLESLPTPALLIEGGTLESAVISAMNAAAQAPGLAAPQPGTPLLQVAREVGIYGPDRRQPVPPTDWPVARALRTGEVVRNEELHARLPSGQWHIVLVGASPLRSDDGRITGAVITLQDLTGHKRAEEEARRLAAIVESSEDAIIAKTLDNIVTDWNPGAEHLFGYRAQEIVGRSFADLVAPEYAATLPSVLQRIRHGEPVRNVEATGVRKDGTHVALSLSVSPVRDSHGSVVRAATIARDITARRRAEEDYARERRFLRQVLDTTPAMVFVKDWDGRFVLVNEALAQCYGVPRERVVGCTDADFNPDPEQVAHFLRDDRDVMSTRGQKLITQEPVTCADGRTRWFTTVKVALVNDDGTCDKVLGVATDITARKSAEAERERLLAAEQQARAEAQEASQAKDRFVAMVSHELRNPLNTILSGLFALRQGQALDARAERIIGIVERSARLQARLVNDLLDLSRLSRGQLNLQRAPVTLDSVARTTVQAYQPEAAEARLTLTATIEPGLWVMGDPDRLEQVVMNLLTNAVKFTPPPGEITVSATREAGRARLCVADTGIGISPELLSGLFEMFRQGEIGGQRSTGLGLGLALVKGIVERLGGQVWAESEGVGKGSRFIVELPLVPAPASAQPGRAPADEGRPAQVLLVEDNADTRTVVADSLSLDGYDVQTAGSGEEALEVLAKAHPDVMLVDLGLPGMDGFTFLGRARQMPGMATVPAFAVTGYGAEEDVQRGRQVGFAGHFVKPVDVAALEQRIREWTAH